jgi:hypothetical protein
MKILKLITTIFALLTFVPVRAQLSFPTSSLVVSYLAGDWRWEKSCGGLSGGCVYPSTVGYTQNLKFTSISATDSIAYIRFKNGNVATSDKTKINATTVNWELQIKGLTSPFSQQYYAIAATKCKFDTLYLSDELSTADCADCYVHVFSHTEPLPQSINHFIDKNVQVEIYPVPSSEEVCITTSRNSQIRRAFILTSIGQKINTAVVNGRIDVSQLPSGSYQLTIETEGNIVNKKMVIFR